MISREEFFNDLRKLITSAESNLKHGRKRIGEKKLMNAYKLLGSYGEPSLRDESLTREERLEAITDFITDLIHTFAVEGGLDAKQSMDKLYHFWKDTLLKGEA